MRRPGVCFLAIVCCVQVAQAHPQSRRLGLPEGAWSCAVWDLSADGRVLVGQCDYATGARGFRWEADEGYLDLGLLPSYDWSGARGVSEDGSVIVGVSGTDAPPSESAWLWNVIDGVVEIIPEARASELSADGDTVVGTLENGSRAFRWTAESGIELLGSLDGMSPTHPRGVSDDGSVVVGFTQFADGYSAFRWDPTSGMEPLGSLAGSPNSLAEAVSGDGQVVTGEAGNPRRAFRWTRETGMVPAVDSDRFTYGYGANRDGSVLVGLGFDGGRGRATVWSDGIVHHLDSWPCGETFTPLTTTSWAVSANGHVVAGTALEGLGNRPHLTFVDTGCRGPLGDLAPGSLVEGIDPPTWRVTGDGEVNVGDVVALLRAVVGSHEMVCGP